MPVSVRGTDILLNDNSKISTDVGRFMTLQGLPRSLSNQISGGGDTNASYLFHNGTGPLNARTTYNTALYYLSFVDNGQYGVAISSSSLVGNAQIQITNYSGSTLRINVTSGIVDLIDDTSAWRLYRDGSILNSSTHSGGTLLHDSGFAARTGTYATPGLATFTQTQDILAQATGIFTLYAAAGSGSGGDAIRPYMLCTFNSWI